MNKLKFYAAVKTVSCKCKLSANLVSVIGLFVIGALDLDVEDRKLN